MKIVVVGASGFVGSSLIERLLKEADLEITALSRHAPATKSPADDTRLRWVSCDLHNLRDLEEALRGHDAAIYLVHSMLPSARLNQGSFADFDLILADNFSRAASLAKIGVTIYLSGLIPDDTVLSAHLGSRLEVEQTLQRYLPTTTTLRAGMIIGTSGSSFRILLNLVERLPVMLCPRWTRNLCQVISLGDVTQATLLCLRRPELQGKVWDIGAEPPISYLKMMQETATILGLRRYFYTVPFMSVGLSKLWVRLVAGAPKNLVYPLVESLKASLVVRPAHRFPLAQPVFKDFSTAVREILPIAKQLPANRPNAFLAKGWRRQQNQVRSIQRLPLPAGRDAAWVAQEYIRFMPRLLPWLLKVTCEAGLISFRLRGLGISLLRLHLASERSFPDRQLFYVVGGILFRPGPARARLEIREALGKSVCLVALHDFQPRLPWLIYLLSQAQVHLWAVHKFGRHLAALSATRAYDLR